MATMIRETGEDPAAVLSGEREQARAYIIGVHGEFGKEKEIEASFLTMGFSTA